jgi:hypothetical protein
MPGIATRPSTFILFKVGCSPSLIAVMIIGRTASHQVAPRAKRASTAVVVVCECQDVHNRDRNKRVSSLRAIATADSAVVLVHSAHR